MRTFELSACLVWIEDGHRRSSSVVDISISSVVAVGHSVAPAAWRLVFDETLARVSPRFCRVEPRLVGRDFVASLLFTGREQELLVAG
jgi:hypothetical protein